MAMGATEKPGPMSTASVMVYLDRDLKERFQKLCVATNQTMSAVLEAFVEDLVARHAPMQGDGR
jgi:predicted transcriptional regulator